MRRPLAHPIPFARYQLIERIGHGGMATVYRARIAGPGGFERDVVVKMMLPALADHLDFGIAKLLEEGPKGRTQTGTLKGKYGYMAPEQATGRAIDHRVDIYATGIVLHELLTGRRLFRGETDLETLRRVAEPAISPPS